MTFSKHNIFKDSNPPSKELLPFKGSSYIESGYVMAPYVPLQIETILPDPINKKIRRAGLKEENPFVMKKGIRTRYGQSQVNQQFYSTTKIT